MDYVDDPDGMQIGASMDKSLMNQVQDVLRRVVAGDITLEDTDDESDGPEQSDDNDEVLGDDNPNAESAGAGE